MTKEEKKILKRDRRKKEAKKEKVFAVTAILMIYIFFIGMLTRMKGMEVALFSFIFITSIPYPILGIVEVLRTK